MKTRVTVALSLAAGIGLGATATQVLHAQAKPPVYVVGEIDVREPEPYFKGYVPGASKAVVDGGGKYVVRGGKSVSFYGEPPKLVAVMVFESMEKAEAAFGSAAYKEAKAVGDRYATFRVYAVEGLPQ